MVSVLLLILQVLILSTSVISLLLVVVLIIIRLATRKGFYIFYISTIISNYTERMPNILLTSWIKTFKMFNKSFNVYFNIMNIKQVAHL